MLRQSNVSEVHIVSIFRGWKARHQLQQLDTCFCWFLAWLTLWPRRWRRYVPPKRQAPSELRAITTQKTILFFYYHGLLNDAANIWNMCHQMVGWLPIMHWKGCQSMWVWPNVRYYSSICLVGQRQTTKNLSKDIGVPSKISTWHFTNWSQKHYCFSLFAWQGIWQWHDNFGLCPSS
jgi:hypothetical protein